MSDTPTPSPLPLDAYYDSGRKCYLVQDREESWMPVEKADIKMRLQRKGIRAKKDTGELIAPIDEVVLRIQDERHVAYAGPLAGYKTGTHMINGSKVLITTSPKMIEAKEGEWPTLRALVENQFTPTGDELDQRIIFYGWLKLADEQFRKCVNDRVCTYGQFLVMAGPRGCGKSLLQRIITEILGGRCAAPYGYMSGATPFNRELFGAEHQMIEDEQPHKDGKSRVRFGEAMKQIAATISRPCYGKNREAQSLEPFWRGTLSVNDEPDHLGVLPPFEDSLADKIIVLHCSKRPMPMPAATADEKEAFWKQLTSELPAFLHWLRNTFTIPTAYRDTEDNRYGLRHFLHPHVKTLLDDMAPETQLLSMIDHCIFASTDATWNGTAEELTHQLGDHPIYGSQAKRIVSTGQWCGRFLAALAASNPDRVSEKRTANLRLWSITKPDLAPKPPATVTSNILDGIL